MSAYSDALIALSPFMYYRLGEASGATCADSSGNGRNGTYNNSPLYGHTSLLANDVDTCVGFGSTRFVEIGDYDVTGDKITLMAWVKINAGGHQIIGKHNTASNVQGTLSVNSSLKTVFEVNHGGTYTALTSDTVLSTGSIYFLVAVYNGSNMKIYINGSLDKTLSSISGNLANNGLSWNIATIANTTPTMDSDIDEVAVFASEIVAADILNLWNIGSGLDVDAAIEKIILTPSGVETPSLGDGGQENLALTASAVELIMRDEGTEIFVLTPSGPDVAAIGDSNAEYFDLQPSGAEGPQYPLVEATTEYFDLQPGGIEVQAKEYSDIATETLRFTMTSHECYAMATPEYQIEVFKRWNMGDPSTRWKVTDLSKRWNAFLVDVGFEIPC